MDRLSLLVALGVFLTTAAYYVGRSLKTSSQADKVSNDSPGNISLEEYRKACLKRFGEIDMPDGQHISYDLMSLDAGKTWFTTDSSGVLSKVENVYPGLIPLLNFKEAVKRESGNLDPISARINFDSVVPLDDWRGEVINLRSVIFHPKQLVVFLAPILAVAFYAFSLPLVRNPDFGTLEGFLQMIDALMLAIWAVALVAWYIRFFKKETNGVSSRLLVQRLLSILTCYAGALVCALVLLGSWVPDNHRLVVLCFSGFWFLVGLVFGSLEFPHFQDRS